MQGVFLTAFKAAERLAAMLDIYVEYADVITKLSQGALSFFDKEKGVFLSSGQVSLASQAWMGLAEVLPQEDHIRAIQLAVGDPKIYQGEHSLFISLRTGSSTS